MTAVSAPVRLDVFPLKAWMAGRLPKDASESVVRRATAIYFAMDFSTKERDRFVQSVEALNAPGGEAISESVVEALWSTWQLEQAALAAAISSLVVTEALKSVKPPDRDKFREIYFSVREASTPDLCKGVENAVKAAQQQGFFSEVSTRYLQLKRRGEREDSLEKIRKAELIDNCDILQDTIEQLMAGIYFKPVSILQEVKPERSPRSVRVAFQEQHPISVDYLAPLYVTGTLHTKAMKQAVQNAIERGITNADSFCGKITAIEALLQQATFQGFALQRILSQLPFLLAKYYAYRECGNKAEAEVMRLAKVDRTLVRGLTNLVQRQLLSERDTLRVRALVYDTLFEECTGYSEASLTLQDLLDSTFNGEALDEIIQITNNVLKDYYAKGQ